MTARHPRTILIISELDYWSLGRGKGGPALWRTLNGYTEHGWTVFFITSNSLSDKITKIPDNFIVLRFDAPWIKYFIQFKKIGFLAKAVWWLYFQIVAFSKSMILAKKHKIDVVYGYEIYGVTVAKILSRLWRIPVVSRFQGTVLGVEWNDRFLRRLRAWEHYLALSISTDLVIMTNDGSQGDRVLKRLRVDSRRVRFWMNGISWNFLENMPSQPEAKKLLGISHDFILLTVSRLEKWKRVDRSLKALPGVVKEIPETILLIVGDGSERKSLEQLSRDLGINEHVRFEGAISHREIPKYLAAADIFLSFYDWSNMGNPLLEAMIAGKCVVTLNNGDTGQIIRDGQNGVLLDYENLSRLPIVIKNLLADQDFRNQLGANATRFAKDRFWTWENRMNAEIQAVENLIK